MDNPIVIAVIVFAVIGLVISNKSRKPLDKPRESASIPSNLGTQGNSLPTNQPQSNRRNETGHNQSSPLTETEVIEDADLVNDVSLGMLFIPSAGVSAPTMVSGFNTGYSVDVFRGRILLSKDNIDNFRKEVKALESVTSSNKFNSIVFATALTETEFKSSEAEIMKAMNYIASRYTELSDYSGSYVASANETKYQGTRYVVITVSN